MTKKFSAAAVSFLFIALMVVPASVVHGQQEPAKQQEETTILVEAYLVQVSSEAMSQAGIAVVPQNSNESATVLKLLQCMVEPQNGRVISSAGAAVKMNNEAQTSSQKKHYISRKVISRKTGDESVTFDSYSTGTAFNVVLHDMNDGRIQISFEYSYTGLDVPSETNLTQDPPADTVEFSAQSSLAIPLDKTIIISNSQQQDAYMFFILRAELVK